MQQDVEFGMLDDIGAKVSDDNTVFDAKINSSDQRDNVQTEDVLPDENGSTPEITGERYFEDKEEIQFDDFGIQKEEEKKDD